MPAIKKRQQIAASNKAVFLAVAVTSVVIGVCGVLLVFLGQKLVFNERVLVEKASTVSVLRHNIEVSDELKNNVRVLNTNERLLAARNSDDDSALQVILEALPSRANSPALGASLENVLLKHDGVTVESIEVDSVVGVESSEGDSDETSTSTETEDNTIAFSFTVQAASVEQLKNLLNQLERSIRAIDVQSVNIEVQQTGVRMSISAAAFYEPEVTVELKDKVVKP